MKLSYSAISSYQNCPMQYKFKYVDKIPAKPSPALSFGNSMHETLHWFYNVPTPNPYTLEELFAAFEKYWIREGYADAEQETKYFYQGKVTLENYYNSNVSNFIIPAALEHRFNINIGICNISGVLDRLDKYPQGGFEIIDYKTNRRIPIAKKLHEDLQLPIYHMAVKAIWGVEPERVSFYYLLHNHKYSFEISRERTNDAVAQIEQVVKGIDAGNFEYKKHGLCPWCDALNVCPAWENQPKPSKTNELRGPLALSVRESVDELFYLDKSMSQIETRSGILKKMLHNYLKEKGASQVAGTIGIAELSDADDVITRPQHNT